MACASVCKKWSEIALDELWRDLQDVYPLLKLVIDNDSYYNEDRWSYFDRIDVSVSKSFVIVYANAITFLGNLPTPPGCGLVEVQGVRCSCGFH